MQSRGVLPGGMMRLRRFLAVATLVVSGVPSSVLAQSGSDFALPAEFPPTGYTARQYTDSRGCMYVRAGIDGQTTWVPRVTRDRKVICGQQPSLAPAAVPAAPRAVSAPEPVQITVPEASQPVKAAPQSKPKPVNRVAAPAKAASAPKSMQKTDTTPTKTLTPVTSATSQRAIIAPRHVYESQIVSTQGVHVPKGYEPVWADDRLNPRRTHQTLEGKAKMERVWTKTVPRRLQASAADR